MSKTFIDPSIRSMGVAYWYGDDFINKQSPCSVHLIETKDLKLNWQERCRMQVVELEKKLRFDYTSRIYCEAPIFMEGFRGITAARSGAIMKLIYLVGMIDQMVMTKFNTGLSLIPISKWKGQLPKSVVRDRIIRLLGKTACREYKKDIWDAVGMGLWKMGVL